MVHVESMTSTATVPPTINGKQTSFVPTKMKILSALPSSDSREESTTTEAVLQQRRDDHNKEDNFVLVSTSLNGSHNRKRHRLDRFGFIANMDRHGNLVDDDEEAAKDPATTLDEAKTLERREQKWGIMLERLPPASVCLRGGRRRKLVLRRVRKGIPETRRPAAWQWLGGVASSMAKNPGMYQRLVEEASEVRPPTPPGEDNKYGKSFKTIQDTIERDIHRTFPRHSMFYEEDTQTDTGVLSDAMQATPIVRTSTEHVESDSGCLVESTREIAAMIRELENRTNMSPKQAPPVHPDYVPPNQVLEAKGGQGSLRRVLKAYSLYDREIGYCQGMNFIAGMFLTLMPEEEAFWLLVGKCPHRWMEGSGIEIRHCLTLSFYLFV